MSKTAEEILRSNIDMSNRAESCEYIENECIKAMREFAAQEVEAYKGRMKAEIGERITNDNHDSCAQAFDSGLHTALTVIDTVK